MFYTLLDISRAVETWFDFLVPFEKQLAVLDAGIRFNDATAFVLSLGVVSFTMSYFKHKFLLSCEFFINSSQGLHLLALRCWEVFL